MSGRAARQERTIKHLVSENAALRHQVAGLHEAVSGLVSAVEGLRAEQAATGPSGDYMPSWKRRAR